MKKALMFLLKLSVSAGLIFWIIEKGKLDFSHVSESFHYLGYWIAFVLVFIAAIMISTYRWKIILDIQEKNISFLSILKFQWVGIFFSTVLPGGILGDFIKIKYIKERSNVLTSSFLLLSIFIDRLVGLCALLFTVGVLGVLFSRELLLLNSSFFAVILSCCFLFLISLMVLALFFIPEKWQRAIVTRIRFESISKLLSHVWQMSGYKKEIFKVFCASIVSQSMYVVAFWVANKPFFQAPLEAKYLVTFVSMGQLAIALPISIAGIGVGHVAFDQLFHSVNHTNGASLFNVFWVLMVIVSLLGFLPYLFIRSSKNQ